MPARRLPRTDDDRPTALNVCNFKWNATADPSDRLITAAQFSTLSLRIPIWTNARDAAADWATAHTLPHRGTTMSLVTALADTEVAKARTYADSIPDPDWHQQALPLVRQRTAGRAVILGQDAIPLDAGTSSIEHGK